MVIMMMVIVMMIQFLWHNAIYSPPVHFVTIWILRNTMIITVYGFLLWRNFPIYHMLTAYTRVYKGNYKYKYMVLTDLPTDNSTPRDSVTNMKVEFPVSNCRLKIKRLLCTFREKCFTITRQLHIAGDLLTSTSSYTPASSNFDNMPEAIHNVKRAHCFTICLHKFLHNLILTSDSSPTPYIR